MSSKIIIFTLINVWTQIISGKTNLHVNTRGSCNFHIFLYTLECNFCHIILSRYYTWEPLFRPIFYSIHQHSGLKLRLVNKTFVISCVNRKRQARLLGILLQFIFMHCVIWTMYMRRRPLKNVIVCISKLILLTPR